MREPRTRAQVRKKMHDYQAQYDQLGAELEGFEASLSQTLDDTDLADLETVARQQAETEIQLRVKKLAQSSIKRRFDELGSKLAVLDRQWAREEVARVQPKIDAKAVEIAATLEKLLGLLKESQTVVHDCVGRVGMTPYLFFSESFRGDIENRIEYYNAERTARGLS